MEVQMQIIMMQQALTMPTHPSITAPSQNSGGVVRRRWNSVTAG